MSFVKKKRYKIDSLLKFKKPTILITDEAECAGMWVKNIPFSNDSHLTVAKLLKKYLKDMPHVEKALLSMYLPNQNDSSPQKSSVRDHNIGNSDYAGHKTQPWDFWLEYALNPWDADIVKRTLRRKVEPGLTPLQSRRLDYEKIIHVCQERIRQIDEGIEIKVTVTKNK